MTNFDDNKAIFAYIMTNFDDNKAIFAYITPRIEGF